MALGNPDIQAPGLTLQVVLRMPYLYVELFIDEMT